MGTAIVSGMLSSSHTQEVPEQTQVGRVSEPESIKLPLFEPADGIMLFWLQVRDNAPPTARDPYGEVQAGLRIDPVQDRSALKALKVGPQLLGHLSPERLFGTLTRQDVTAREVPHVWIPPPTRRPVTEQHLVCPSQDRGNDVMILHRSSMTLAGQGLLDTALGSAKPIAQRRPQGDLDAVDTSGIMERHRPTRRSGEPRANSRSLPSRPGPR
jgi:hypothetical protein